MNRKPYPTDLTDDQWEGLEPLLPRSRCGTPKGGRPPADPREVANAIFYHLRGGLAWQTVYGYFRAWRDAGVWDQVHARLREDVRVGAGYPPAPEALRVDSETVKTTHRCGPRGYDGEKRRPAASGSWPPIRSG